MTFQHETTLEKSSESTFHKSIQSSKTQKDDEKNDENNKKKIQQKPNPSWYELISSDEDDLINLAPKTNPKQPENKQIPTPKQLLSKSDEISSKNNNKINRKQAENKLEIPKGNSTEPSTEDSETNSFGPKTTRKQRKDKLQTPKKTIKNWDELSTEDSEKSKFVPKTTSKEPENKQIPTPKQQEYSYKTNKNQLNNKNYDNNDQNNYTKLPNHCYGTTTTNHQIFYNNQKHTVTTYQEIPPPIQPIQEPSDSSYQTEQNEASQPVQQPYQRQEQIYNMITSAEELKTLIAALLIEEVKEDIKKANEKLQR